MTPLPPEARTAIRLRRLELGLTQPEAAKIGGVSVATWNAIENGRSSGSDMVRTQMCKALHWRAGSIERLSVGQKPIMNSGRRDGSADGSHDGSSDGSSARKRGPEVREIEDALAALAAAMERLTGEVAAQRALLDRVIAAELDRRR